MTDLGIFIFGCCVFGVAITATMVVVLAPSHEERERTLVDSSKKKAKRSNAA